MSNCKFWIHGRKIIEYCVPNDNATGDDEDALKMEEFHQPISAVINSYLFTIFVVKK